jgi:two-component system chemotaxis response regulator CheY
MPDSSKLQVLVVDDDPSTQRLFTVVLQSQGCEIAGLADNGADAVALFKESSPGLVLLDVDMPEMNGIDALKEILSVDSAASVVMLTTEKSQSVAGDCILAGAKDYIQKDLGLDGIHVRLSEVLAEINA